MVPGAAAEASPENLIEKLVSDPEPLGMGPKDLPGPPGKSDTLKVSKGFVTLKRVSGHIQLAKSWYSNEKKFHCILIHHSIHSNRLEEFWFKTYSHLAIPESLIFE